jgi:glycosyltransferase involved in cell wall biosynthesis
MVKVATILPIYLYDELKLFKKAVLSILEQTYQDFTLIIVIDGPIKHQFTDYINKIKSSKIEILSYSQNRGLAAVLNDAIRYCKSKDYDYIVRMDADDLSHKERLDKQIKYLNSNPDVSVLGTQAYIIDNDDNIIGKKNASPSIDYNILKKKSDIIHPSVIFRSTFFDTVGYYSENVSRAEDYDLWFRAAEKDLVINSIEDRLYYFRYDDKIIERRKGAQKHIINVKKKYMSVIDYPNLLSHYIIRLLPNFILKYILYKSIKKDAKTDF